MTWTDFVTRFEQLGKERNQYIILRLNPVFEQLPLPIQRFDDPFFPFGKEIIRATRDLVCGYMFDLSAYLAMGGAGGVALERTIRYVGRENVTILHGPFGNTNYGAMADITGFGVDAVTVTSSNLLTDYLNQPPFAAFTQAEDESRIPQEGGLYSLPKNRIKLHGLSGNVIDARITTDDILYAGRLEGFAQEVRHAVEELA